MSVIIELSQAQLDSIAQQQHGTPPTGGGIGAPANVQTFEHGAQQPVVPDVNGLVWVADLSFNGKRFATQGLKGQPPFYFRFKNGDMHSVGWSGLVAQIQYSEHAEFGGQQYTKTCCLSQNGATWTDNTRYGSSGNYMVSFDCDYPGAIRMDSHTLWYLCVKYEMQNGNQSAKSTDDGDMQVTPSAPAHGA